MRKILYVILDGVGDRPSPALGGRTPLAAAATPHLDRLASRGRLGLVQTVGPGIAPESDVAVMAILGYDPHRYHVGRGVLEALGAGMRFQDGELALRGNFATVGTDGRILDRRVGRSLKSEEAAALAAALNAEMRLDGASCETRATVGYRCAVVITSTQGPLSAAVGNTDPAYARVGGLGVAKAAFEEIVQEAVPLDESATARRAAALVNAYTRRTLEILDRHPVNDRRRGAGLPPANAILLRDGGDRLPDAPPMAERFGVRLACLVEMPVERGISRALGMDVVEIAPGRGYTAWAETARGAIDRYDGLYLHLKGPDEPGHDGDYERKRASIEQIDAEFFGTMTGGSDDWLWAVTADHATPWEAGAHTDDPVPLLISGAGSDGPARFTEADGARGSLGLMRGIDVLPLALKMAGR